MSLPEWPASVRSTPLRDNYSITPMQVALVTEMDDGPVRQRRRSTSDWTTISMSFVWTPVEYDNFRNFWLTSLNRGASRFTMPIQGEQFGVANRTVYIEGGIFTAKPFGVRWQVSFTLCVLDY